LRGQFFSFFIKILPMLKSAAALMLPPIDLDCGTTEEAQK